MQSNSDNYYEHMDLMTCYRKDIANFFYKKGVNTDIYDFRKAERTFERLPFNDMSYTVSFMTIIEKYFGEKLLKEIYFNLFHKYLYEPITEEEFDKMNFKTKSIFVFKKGIPKHAKNYFQSFFRVFVVIHLYETKQFKTFAKLALIDPNSTSIVKEFLLNR